MTFPDYTDRRKSINASLPTNKVSKENRLLMNSQGREIDLSQSLIERIAL